jgi:hypothetical protein
MEDNPLFDSGTPFVCRCRCHLPLGFVLPPGRTPPPIMRPCDECKAIHP